MLFLPDRMEGLRSGPLTFKTKLICLLKILPTSQRNIWVVVIMSLKYNGLPYSRTAQSEY